MVHKLHCVLQALLGVALADVLHPGWNVGHLGSGGTRCQYHPLCFQGVTVAGQHAEVEYFFPGEHRDDFIHCASDKHTVQIVLPNLCKAAPK